VSSLGCGDPCALRSRAQERFLPYEVSSCPRSHRGASDRLAMLPSGLHRQAHGTIPMRSHVLEDSKAHVCTRRQPLGHTAMHITLLKVPRGGYETIMSGAWVRRLGAPVVVRKTSKGSFFQIEDICRQLLSLLRLTATNVSFVEPGCITRFWSL